MKSGQPANTTEENQPGQSNFQHRSFPPHDMKVDEKGVVLLSTIKKQLPLLMPRASKRMMLDKITMHAAIVTQERGEKRISEDDILIGIHQALPSPFANYIYAKLKITPEAKAEYRQRSFDIDHVIVDEFLQDLKIHAKKCGAEIREDKLRPILDCYQEIFEWHSLYVKTTTRDIHPRELFIRPGHSGRWFDLAALAKEHGVADFYDHPAYQTYSSICRKIGAVGSMADISTDGEIQKFYAFFVHKAQPVSTIKKCKNIPEAVFKNSALLESWGFKRFSIFGVDFKNNSLNLYYYTNQTEFNRTKIETILTALGFPLPSEEILRQMEDAALVYFTFTHTSDRIERICFTKVYEDELGEAVKIVPSLGDYMEQAPLKSTARNLLLGFAFNKKGHYLKIELDYKASLQIPGKMKYSGLYSNSTM